MKWFGYAVFLIILSLELTSEFDFATKQQFLQGCAEIIQRVNFTSSKITDQFNLNSLILATNHSVFEEDLFYKSEAQITGMDIFVKEQLLFLSDASGFVFKLKLKPNATRVDLLSSIDLESLPFDLSVDWLWEKLYIVGQNFNQWKIYKCELDGSGLMVAVEGLTSKPENIYVDPYSGYMFWLQNGFSQHSGLYRFDLADTGSKHKTYHEIILRSSYLGPFVVDHKRNRILASYPHPENKIVVSVSFDGTQINRVSEDRYYDEMFDVILTCPCPDCKAVVNLLIWQPVPVPVNPPTQVRIASEFTQISWKAPNLINGQGKGAWQKWLYIINITDVTTMETYEYDNIETTFYTLHNLKEDTIYKIKIAAYSNAGIGPWSEYFEDRIIKQPVDQYPLLIWSTSNGLFTSNIKGENIHTLMNKDNITDFNIINIDWYEDELYLVNKSSHLYSYNLKSNNCCKIINTIDSIESVAIDWIGKKLYWTNIKKESIVRSNFDGTEQEHLLNSTKAIELKIDSVYAYIYWYTINSVECARLNGNDTKTYYFDDKNRIKGLALDKKQENIYWIVQSHIGAILYRQKMAHHISSGVNKLVHIVRHFPDVNIRGSLNYFNDHFLWLQDDYGLVKADIHGQNYNDSNLFNKSKINMVSILDPQSHNWPYKHNKTLKVLPASVSSDSVQVKTSKNESDSFYITWFPVKVVYGTVYYEVEINYGTKVEISDITTNSYIKFWKIIPPHTRLIVTIRSFTYWNSAQCTKVELFSPSSAPSIPRNIRCTVTIQRRPLEEDDKRYGIFRWNTPKYENGILLGYILKCWYFIGTVKIDLCHSTFTKRLQHHFVDIPKNEISYQVQAVTNGGKGNFSTIKKCDTSYEKPMPTLLAVVDHSISMLDFDSKRDHSMICNGTQMIDIAYIKTENLIFWINENYELFRWHIKSKSLKLIELNITVTSLTVDWVQRCLFIVHNNFTVNSSKIYRLDMNKNDNEMLEIEHVLTRNQSISRIAVSPYTRSLYWMELNEHQNNVLMQIKTDSYHVKTLFEENNQSCNCFLHSSIAQHIIVDHSDELSRPQIYFIDSKSKDIITTDKHGCICKPIIKNTLIMNTLPWREMGVDKYRIFWSNLTEDRLYYINRNETKIRKKRIKVKRFLILGAHMQPFPESKCLRPQTNSQPVQYSSTSADSITLLMPPILQNEGCNNISMATGHYVISYSPYENCAQLNCGKNLTTFNQTFTVTGLLPYTNYSFAIATRNYFTTNECFGENIVIQTAAGAPSEPQQITVIGLNLTAIQVEWLPPEKFHGKSVLYEIRWTLFNSFKTVEGRIVFEANLKNANKSNVNRLFKKAIIHNVFLNQTYSIWVRAYSKDKTYFTDSKRIEFRTYPAPKQIVQIYRTPKILILNWEMSALIENYNVQYANVLSNNWLDIPNPSLSYNVTYTLYIKVENLKPKTKYKLRLNLKYYSHLEKSIWPSVTDEHFIFETEGAKPSIPDNLKDFIENGVHHLSWTAPYDGGSPIKTYNLEVLKYFGNNSWTQEEEWISCYNGTDSNWTVLGLDSEYSYMFRVSAYNEFGWSEKSAQYYVDLKLKDQQPSFEDTPILVILASAVFFLLCASYYFTVIYRRKRPKLKYDYGRSLQERLEIMTLNKMYIPLTIRSEDLQNIPQISKDQIQISKKSLGSGHFGVVYEGEMKRTEDDTPIKVAVKKQLGNTMNDQIEFFLEAGRMCQLTHSHIVQIYGICSTEQCILLELMEAGDLLKYLHNYHTELTLKDQLSICIDVARGCKYLEEKHFVHRDLACRNCLVSSIDPQKRIVKISDFGLARDIYKNNYYRIQNLNIALPIRWMAPESLNFHTFTSKSDVWSFGILMWEIMTFGKEPYETMSNEEVDYYVRNRGTLGESIHSSHEHNLLMKRCWKFEPKSRPTFDNCLNDLLKLYESEINDRSTGEHMIK